MAMYTRKRSETEARQWDGTVETGLALVRWIEEAPFGDNDGVDLYVNWFRFDEPFGESPSEPRDFALRPEKLIIDTSWSDHEIHRGGWLVLTRNREDPSNLELESFDDETFQETFVLAAG